MLGKKLWVWVGSPDDRLDVLRYVTATDRDVLAHPAVVKERDGLAAVLVAEQGCRRDAMEKLSASRAEAERLRGVLSGFAEADCEYGDGCPDFGSRHYRCTGCIARAALAEEGER